MEDVDQLRAELADLRRRHDALLARLDAIASGPVASGADVAHTGGRVGRRLVLGGAAAAAGSMVVLARDVHPVQAAGVLPLENGRRNVLGRQTSFVNATGEPAGPTETGVALTDTDVMVVVDNSASSRLGASALQAAGRTRSITASTSEGGTVIDARAGAVDGIGVSAVASGAAGVGVIASGAAYGIRAGGGAIGGDFIGNAYGITVAGGRPLVFAGGHGSAGPPVTTGNLGEVAYDLGGNLYLCVEPGTPARWRRLAGPATAGSLHLLGEPRRVYDSRSNAAPVGPSNGGPKGPITNGETRTIDCKANGAPTPPDAVGLLFNLAVTSTNSAGFLTAWGSGVLPLASAMNWSQSDVTASNSVTIRSGDNATFQLHCGGGGVAHVIVDLAGYYR